MCRTNSVSWQKVSPPRYCRLSFDLREEVFWATDGGRVVFGALGRGCTHHTLHTVMRLILMHKTGGKRTFSSLVSKVKAKVQEFDQTRYADLHPPFFGYTTTTATIYLHLLLLFTPRTTPEEDERGGSRGVAERPAITVIFCWALTPTDLTCRNTQNPSPPSAGASSQQYATSSGLDRHAQQAYYAPRLDPSPRVEGECAKNAVALLAVCVGQLTE